MRWVSGSFTRGSESYGDTYVDTDALTALQLGFRLDPPLTGSGEWDLLNDLQRRMRQSDEFSLDVIDWMLHHWQHFGADPYVREWAGELNDMLHQGGSAWEVTQGNGGGYRLSRRAVGPVVEVLEDTATHATRAHAHMEAAWSKLTGRNPDPSGAYREAVRAVEAVAKPIILPASGRATLGQMIAAMKDKPDKWAATIGTVDDVRSQMEAVWRGQLDRHGTDDETVPLNVSPAQADAAFSACLNLVRLFAGGHVVHLSDEEIPGHP